MGAELKSQFQQRYWLFKLCRGMSVLKDILIRVLNIAQPVAITKMTDISRIQRPT